MVPVQMRRKQMISFSSRNLIADIFGESGDEEEEEFTVSIGSYFLFDYAFCFCGSGSQIGNFNK